MNNEIWLGGLILKCAFSMVITYTNLFQSRTTVIYAATKQQQLQQITETFNLNMS